LKSNTMTARSVFGLLLIGTLLDAPAHAVAATLLDLYSLDVAGQIHRVNPATGASLGSFNLPSNRQWNDIAATSFDPTGIYAVSLVLGSGARRFSRVDALTGTLTDITLTNASGGTNPLIYGLWSITFDPETPHLGYMAVAASTSQGVQLNRLARLNLVTRQFETSLETTHRWAGLAMNSQGELIGSVDIFIFDDSHGSSTTQVYNIDPNTGQSTLRFTVASRDVTRLAYHPTDERLFAIDGVANDDLVLLDRESGALARVGDLPTGGPNGLAFTSFAGLLGDYNGDGAVDATDYSSWRDSLGQSIAPGNGAAGSLNGLVDQADYIVWKAHFGEQIDLIQAAGLGSHSTIPEPATLLPVAAAAAGLSLGFRRTPRARYYVRI
jgi:hypothetical protein